MAQHLQPRDEESVVWHPIQPSKHPFALSLSKSEKNGLLEQTRIKKLIGQIG